MGYVSFLIERTYRTGITIDLATVYPRSRTSGIVEVIMLETIFVQPIFNLLVVIYALLPGHNFGLALIIFTIIVRLLLWPLIKKQLHNAKAIRELQPELKKIRARAKGNKLLERQMTLELYKEREINPFSSLGIALLQLPILIGLYAGLSKIVKDPTQIVDFSYGFVQNFDWMQRVADNIKLFDETLFRIVDLTRPAFGSEGFYLPAFIIVIGAAVTQYIQSRQLMPVNKDARKLRTILKEAGDGKQADQEELSAAVNKTMIAFLPVLIFAFTLGIASALSLYIFVSALVAVLQQTYVLRQDVAEIEASGQKANEKIESSEVLEGEVIDTKNPTKAKKSKGKKAKKRRK